MVDGYGYSTAAASAAFAFFLLMMTIVRFASPRLEARLGSPKLLRIVDGAYHELLNEPEGPGLIRDIVIWLGEH